MLVQPEVVMNLMMIMLLVLPIISIAVLHWFPDKYLPRHKWIPAIFPVIYNLIGVAIFIIIRLTDTPDYHHLVNIPWFRLPGVSYYFSLSLNPYSGWFLALWSGGNLLFTFLTATAYFKINTYRRSLIHLCLSALAVNGFILTNDLLSVIFFWTLLDICAYLIVAGDRNVFNEHRQSFFQSLSANLLLLLATLSLLKVSGTYQIDLIISQLQSGVIGRDRILLPGILIIISGLLRILQPWLSRNNWMSNDNFVNTDSDSWSSPGDDFCVYYGLIPSGLLLIIKSSQLFTTFCLHSLWVAGFILAIIISAIIFKQTDFKRFIRLNLLLQIALVLIALGIKAIALSMFLIFGLLTTTILLIIFNRDYQTGLLYEAEPGSALMFPIRIVMLMNLIGFPLTANFNTRLLLFGSTAYQNNGTNPNLLLGGATGLILWMLSASIFKLFLHTHALEPIRRKTPALSPAVQWTAGTLALISLFPMITFPDFNPLTIVLRNSDLFVLKPAVVWQNGVLSLAIVYIGLMLFGLLTGFLVNKYMPSIDIFNLFSGFFSNLKDRIRFVIDEYAMSIARKLVRFDMIVASDLSLKIKNNCNHAIAKATQFNNLIANKFNRLETVPAALSENLFWRIRQIQFNLLILIALLILSVVILICII